MTESQRYQSLLLELIYNSLPHARPIEWLRKECALAGYNNAEILRETLNVLEDKKLLSSSLDALDTRRWSITSKGQALIQS